MEERERKKWNKEKRESVSCMWRVPILMGSPLGPTSGPLPQENPQVQEPPKINH